MQTIKYKKPIPIWIIAVVVIIAAIAIIFALGLSGLFGDFLGTVATGLINLFTTIFTVPYQWASANIINGITFTVAGIVIIGLIFLMIAKRRYLVSEKVAIGGVAPAYQPQAQLSTPQLYSNPAPAPQPPVEQPVEEKPQA